MSDAVLKFLSKADTVIITTVVTTGITLLAKVIENIITLILNYKEKRREYLDQKREAPYFALISLIYKRIHRNTDVISEEILEEIKEFSENMILWGSSKVINKLFIVISKAEKKCPPEEIIASAEEMVNEMRKDMSQKKTNKNELCFLFKTGNKNKIETYNKR
ncbi:MAG: hypothetical protein KBT47_08460 [Armatimonadetes bacterium]|nr:hypothetical protein [Candidatus Hippobium faecium]